MKRVTRYRRYDGTRAARRFWRTSAAAAVAALLVTGCGAASGPDAASVAPTTSAASVADSQSSASAVVVPGLESASAPKSTPTPWQSLTTTATTTTTSEAPLTAPTTTRTLTFDTVASATAPTVAAPTEVASPPPDCYGSGACPVLASATASAGKVEVVNDGSTTVAVLSARGSHAAAVLAKISSPKVACTGSYCLVQGKQSGIYFGTLLRIKDGALRTVPGTPSSTKALTLLSGPVVAGTVQFDGYGLWPSDSPVAARTWALSGGQLASTGCGSPVLYGTPAAPGGALNGPCSGTPRIAGHGKASAHKAVQLGGFVTPSGNIACALTLDGDLACTAKKHSVKVAKCSVSTKKIPKALRGLRVTLGTSGGSSVDDCLGYTLIGAPTTKISYNRMAVGGGFACEVQQSGVTCTNKSGRGFTLSSSGLSRF